MQIIFLNGPTSSGKSTLAKRLQQELEEPFLHIGIDHIIEMMPSKLNQWAGEVSAQGFWWKIDQDSNGKKLAKIQMGPFAHKISETLCETVLTFAKMGHFIIVDDVIVRKSTLEKWRNCLAPFKVLWVEVNAPIEILEERELQRKDRTIGSARAQAQEVVFDGVWDLHLDTFQKTPEENTEKIRKALKKVDEPEATHKRNAHKQ